MVIFFFRSINLWLSLVIIPTCSSAAYFFLFLSLPSLSCLCVFDFITKICTRISLQQTHHFCPFSLYLLSFLSYSSFFHFLSLDGQSCQTANQIRFACLPFYSNACVCSPSFATQPHYFADISSLNVINFLSAVFCYLPSQPSHANQFFAQNAFIFVDSTMSILHLFESHN